MEQAEREREIGEELRWREGGRRGGGGCEVGSRREGREEGREGGREGGRGELLALSSFCSDSSVSEHLEEGEESLASGKV